MYLTRCSQFMLSFSNMPKKLTEEQKTQRREARAKKWKKELELCEKKRNGRKYYAENKEKLTEQRKKREQKRHAQWTRLIETVITDLVHRNAYQGHVEVYRQIQRFMETTGLESSDVDSVVNCRQLYDKWWEDFHLNAGHTEPDLATSIIKKVNHHAHEGYDKMKRALDQHVAVQKKNWDDIRRVVDIDQVYEDWWKGYHAGEKKGFDWILVRSKCCNK